MDRVIQWPEGYEYYFRDANGDAYFCIGDVFIQLMGHEWARKEDTLASCISPYRMAELGTDVLIDYECHWTQTKQRKSLSTSEIILRVLENG